MKTSLPSTGQLSGEQIQRLLEIGQKVNEERDLPSLLHVASREASRLLEAERSSVFLLDHETCELWSLIALPNESIRFDARLGIAGAVAMTGKMINVVDAQKDSRFHKGIDSQTKYRTRSVLAIPLQKISGEIIGTFQFLNKKNGAFSESDENLGTALAAQVAQAIVTAGLVGNLKLKHQELEKENQELRKEIEGQSPTQRIMGTSQRIQQIVRTIDQISDCSFDVLVTGENGTGKELVAKAIHANSPRAHKPFVELNCAALPDNLVESELFGIEKGVATGVDARIGKFEQAQGGTLFLDEIGDLSESAQAKILRVLQERRLEPIGKRESVPIDVRVVAATNKDLKNAISQGKFREDLYYRLKVIHISTAPLREIHEEIPLLANFFLLRYCREIEADPKRFAPRTLRVMQTYHWPGNIRQLENEVKRLVVMVRGDVISPEDLDESLHSTQEPKLSTGDQQSGQNLKESIDMVEKQIIEQALQTHHYHQGHTAKALGISRQGLIKKMKRYGIEGS